MHFKTRLIWLLFLLLAAPFGLLGQISILGDFKVDYNNPRDFVIGGIQVEGTQFLDREVLVMLSGLRVGETVTVPGDKISKAVQQLWKQGLFGDVSIVVDRVEGETIFLKYILEELPRLSRFAFSRNLKKGQVDDINDKLKIYRGKIVTENMKKTSEAIIRDFYTEKGYWDVKVELTEQVDTNMANAVIMRATVKLGKKVKIGEVRFDGNEALSSKKLKKSMKGTKEYQKWNIFRNAKFLEEKYEEDKNRLMARYQTEGYRDARIVRDTIFRNDENRFSIHIKLEEGQRYYFRDIRFVGNTLYSDSVLSKILGIERGEVYNRETLDTRLQIDPNGRDISSLYMDNGYLFFNVTPVEVRVEKDSIDLEIRIYEGSQAIINKVTVSGNDKTSDHVIIRELRTRPGQKFSRSDIIRTTRELNQLGYFDPEQLGVVPIPNPANGTVDIEYKVVERSNDQVELSGGWGAGQVVGSLGLVLNNFSARKFFQKDAWKPVPSGDGQRASIRVQSNGRFFQSYNISFTEPWLGGKQPNALTVSAYTSIQSNGLPRADVRREGITINGISVSLGRRLTVPDDYFTLVHSVNYQQFILNNNRQTVFLPNGVSNNFFFRETLSRNSIDQPIYPRSGSSVTLTLQITPPYSLLGRRDFADLPAEDRFKWIEYHKWRFDSQYYLKLVGDLVLLTRVQFGFMANFDPSFGNIPFGRYYVGGDGIMGFNLDDRELIGLRGYQNNTLTPRDPITGQFLGATTFQKYTMELRYPITLNPSATIFVTSFLEGGNSFLRVNQFDPFNNFRSAGAGVRVFLPMFGLLGVDWGYGFDRVPGLENANRGNIHISIGQNF
jgi:outer membrane protein insertion porin family